MSLLSSNGVSIESISIKGLHNRSIELIKSVSEGRTPPQAMLHFMEKQGDEYILRSILIFIPKNIVDNPELTDENIQVMKEYLYDKFKGIGAPLRNIDLGWDSIKEKNYVL